MALFRMHCGTLEASMATAVEVNTLHELRDHLKSILMLDDVGEILITPNSLDGESCHDKRTGWDTYAVMVHGSAVGFTNGIIAD
jgi:hypothetical protein